MGLFLYFYLFVTVHVCTADPQDFLGSPGTDPPVAGLGFKPSITALLLCALKNLAFLSWESQSWQGYLGRLDEAYELTE